MIIFLRMNSHTGHIDTRGLRNCLVACPKTHQFLTGVFLIFHLSTFAGLLSLYQESRAPLYLLKAETHHQLLFHSFSCSPQSPYFSLLYPGKVGIKEREKIRKPSRERSKHTPKSNFCGYDAFLVTEVR